MAFLAGLATGVGQGVTSLLSDKLQTEKDRFQSTRDSVSKGEAYEELSLSAVKKQLQPIVDKVTAKVKADNLLNAPEDKLPTHLGFLKGLSKDQKELKLIDFYLGTIGTVAAQLPEKFKLDNPQHIDYVLNSPFVLDPRTEYQVNEFSNPVAGLAGPSPFVEPPEAERTFGEKTRDFFTAKTSDQALVDIAREKGISIEDAKRYAVMGQADEPFMPPTTVTENFATIVQRNLPNVNVAELGALSVFFSDKEVGQRLDTLSKVPRAEMMNFLYINGGKLPDGTEDPNPWYDDNLTNMAYAYKTDLDLSVKEAAGKPTGPLAVEAAKYFNQALDLGVPLGLETRTTATAEQTDEELEAITLGKAEQALIDIATTSLIDDPSQKNALYPDQIAGADAVRYYFTTDGMNQLVNLIRRSTGVDNKMARKLAEKIRRNYDTSEEYQKRILNLGD
jgi:hypothetical protein